MYDAEMGEFPWLEQALADAGVAFDRHSDARFEYNAEWRYNRPPMGDAPAFDQTCRALSDSSPAIEVDTLAWMARQGWLRMKTIHGWMKARRPEFQS
jgi:hypothetical protein